MSKSVTLRSKFGYDDELLTQFALDSLVPSDPVEPHQGGVANVVEDVGHDLHWLVAEERKRNVVSVY